MLYATNQPHSRHILWLILQCPSPRFTSQRLDNSDWHQQFITYHVPKLLAPKFLYNSHCPPATISLSCMVTPTYYQHLIATSVKVVRDRYLARYPAPNNLLSKLCPQNRPNHLFKLADCTSGANSHYNKPQFQKITRALYQLIRTALS